MRSRADLHFSKIEDFAKYCEAQGWVREPLKSEFEVLRMRKETESTPLLVHSRDLAKEHCTIWGTSYVLYSEWRKSQGKRGPW